ncbi:glutathione S-transferase, alpha tandem duplicate 1 [Brienomyrus brachyistius]|uniref:glutathione S-transferase, alpha tandem duplicate 1 n=1 Tax=Brienomyrus brachyistius TaxID=42636 RepID=UPI0020B37851|nr:glutathione S-transferase, alpha tandem duplicate 1 [Brienomyrus brachyistius]
MAEKVTLYYFDGRGQMESIRWLLAVAGVEFDEVILKTREQFLNLLKDGSLMFQQVPLVEMDGLKLVQTKAILNYISAKYNLYGKDLKERVKIDMFAEGTRDLMDMMKMMPFLTPDNQKAKLDEMHSKALERYFPVYEKALSNSQYLVGEQLSCADIHLLEATFMVEEKCPSVLSTFPNLQAFQARMTSVPAISKFLQPGSKRKAQPDEVYVRTVKEVLGF